jgi:hypothetical protein
MKIIKFRPKKIERKYEPLSPRKFLLNKLNNKKHNMGERYNSK